MMQTVVWLLFLLKVAYMTVYDAGPVCPDPVLWDIIGRYVCPGRKYFCLWDEIRLKFGEKCHATDRLEQKGKRTLLNKGNFNRKPCADTTFQPFTFNASGNTRCVYLKSLCSEEGQITVDFNSTVEDTQCRCNHAGGYAPLGQTKNPCYCVPSMEDCTCYKKICDMDEVLLPNYTCIRKIEDIALQTKPCSEIGIVTDRIPTGPKDKQITNSAESGKDYTFAIIMTVNMLLFCLAWVYIYRRWWKIKMLFDEVINCCIPLKLVGDYGGVNICFEGEKVQLECKANKSGRSWFKNGKKIEANDCRITIKDIKGTGFSIEIFPVSIQDSGRYSFYRKDKVVAELKVKEVKIVHELKERYVSFTGDPVEFICEVNTEKVMGNWFKGDEELSTGESILIESVDKRCTLRIFGLLEKDEGEYKFSIGNKSCTTTLSVLVYSREEIGHYKLNRLVRAVALPIVRKFIFDKEFNPNKLMNVLEANEGTIQGLPISKKEKKMLYVRKVNSTVTSEDLDLKVMIILLKELADMKNVSHHLPYEGNMSIEDDLSRINHILSVLNLKHGIKEDTFRTYCQCLKEVAKRLAGNEYDETIERIVNCNPKAEDIEKYFENPNNQAATRSYSTSSDLKIVEEATKSEATVTWRTKLTELVAVEAWSSLNKNQEHFSEWLSGKKISLPEFKLLNELQDSTKEGKATKEVIKDYLKKLDTKLMMIFLKYALHNKFIEWNLGNLVDVSTLEILHDQVVKSSIKGMKEAVKHLDNHEDILEKARQIFTAAKDSKIETEENGGKTSKALPKAAEDDKKAESKGKVQSRTMIDDIIEEVTKKVLHESVTRLCEKCFKELRDLNNDCGTCKQLQITSIPHLIDWNLAEMYFAMNHANKKHLQCLERERTLNLIDGIIKSEKERKLKDYIEMIQDIGGELP